LEKVEEYCKVCSNDDKILSCPAFDSAFFSAEEKNSQEHSIFDLENMFLSKEDQIFIKSYGNGSRRKIN